MNTTEYSAKICKQYNLTSRQFKEIRDGCHYAKAANRDEILTIVFEEDEHEAKNFEYCKAKYEKYSKEFNELNEEGKRVACAGAIYLYDGYFEAMRLLGFECWNGSNAVEMYMNRNWWCGMKKLSNLSMDLNHHYSRASWCDRGFRWGKIDVEDAGFDPMVWAQHVHNSARFTDEQRRRFDYLIKAAGIGFELSLIHDWHKRFEEKYNKAFNKWTKEIYIPRMAQIVFEEKKKAAELRKANKVARAEMKARERECKTIEELWALKRPEIEDWAKKKLGITDEAKLERVITATLKKHYSSLPE